MNDLQGTAECLLFKQDKARDLTYIYADASIDMFCI